jgi:hypothetical protein
MTSQIRVNSAMRNQERAYGASSMVQTKLNEMWNDCKGNEQLQYSIEYMMQTMHYIRNTWFAEELADQIKRMSCDEAIKK